MDVFTLRESLVKDYQEYTSSFIKIGDPRIEAFVTGRLNDGELWPEPLLQLNPNYRAGGSVDDLVREDVLHKECSRIFRRGKSEENHRGEPLIFHQHQQEAILKAKAGESYVLTSGTGSGKSLAYIVPIVDHVLRLGSGKGIQAIVVYPMNALANSQDEELQKFLRHGYGEGEAPVTFARYTGQEKREERERIKANPPDILLTNYMMLELMLTRREDREVIRAAQGLKFLVFDELHTYRGRQGADVALLIRRCRQALGGHEIICVGTSATMASEGETHEQRVAVANVAQSLFGTPFGGEQIIGETLERATPEVDLTDAKTVGDLRAAVMKETEPPSSYEDLRGHPFSSWIESSFGIAREQSSGVLIRQTPKRLRGKHADGRSSASAELAELTGIEAEPCAEALKAWLLHGANVRQDGASPYPLFAFRLHQFITRGDTVWTTLEAEQDRHFEISKKAAKPGEPDKPLFPLVFCRCCGAAYYRVWELPDGDGGTIQPREDRSKGDEDGVEGYLYLSSEQPWPVGDESAMLGRVPAFMKEESAQGDEKIISSHRRSLPVPKFVTPDGTIVDAGEGLLFALIRGNFRFCLNPECGIAYSGHQKSERAKLSTLGVDNRSTATTILALRSLIELQASPDLDDKARKLLSFTDNRQDASLQAGHFNDFVQVALLRSALCRAVKEAGPGGLRHGDLSRKVFEAMHLQPEEYAADPNLRGLAQEAPRDAMRKVVNYLLYVDLERGWRVTAPNLEECGLLGFDYECLNGNDGLLGDEEIWNLGIKIQDARQGSSFVNVPPPLQLAPPELRELLLRTLVDLMRKSLAIKVDVLDRNYHYDLVQQTKNRLRVDTSWYLEDERELKAAKVAFPRSSRSHGAWEGLYLSSYGAFGRFLKRKLLEAGADKEDLRRDDVDKLIHFLLLSLKTYGIVEQVRSGQAGDDPGYQLNADALHWLPGTGEARPIDRIRLQEEGETPLDVNKYFVGVYETFVDLKCLLEAREHTAQVPADLREEREQDFRDAKLPLLFCSPTMELGVDIDQLNLVNLRNVPPTPANYVQRSGRAGRSGQAALVFTYCAGRSPHDQYYYREPTRMVAGAVAPPRIDLYNCDLIRSHVHAIWMEVARPDLGVTLTSVLDLSELEGEVPLPVLVPLSRELQDPRHKRIVAERAEAVLADLQVGLSETTWFHDRWLTEVLDQLERSFDSACGRWRSLYRSALRQRHVHHKVVGDQARPEPQRNQSRRLRAQAESQITLLTKAEGVYQGDFYTYRYFATEGFLPGYNFPRLPLSAFVPSRRRRTDRDEYISRPRFLAITEFGPQALVYHEGTRYSVDKVNLDFGADTAGGTQDLVTSVMKRCEHCGYAHVEEEGKFAVQCDRCEMALEMPSTIDNMVHLQNVTLRMRQRINCDEEERQRLGYKIATAYRFPEVGGSLDRKDATVWVGDLKVLELSYGDATDLFRINLGWATSKEDQAKGFLLELERGTWASNSKVAADGDAANQDGTYKRVVPFVKDTKNALVMRFVPSRSLQEMAALQAIFKQAIQLEFQLESRELSCEAMPHPSDRQEILFYESSEGGAGVLRQIATDPKVFPRLARRALEACHFDPNTLEDLAAAECGRACYQCLLDYGNQPDHQMLDRMLIRDQLSELMRGDCRPAGGVGTRSERLVELTRRCDSQLEKRWLKELEQAGLRLPSDAQYLIPGYYAQPDFFYGESNAAIYIDGPVHDESGKSREDAQATTDLIARGYIVIRFHYRDEWPEVFARHPDVFGQPS